MKWKNIDQAITLRIKTAEECLWNDDSNKTNQDLLTALELLR